MGDPGQDLRGRRVLVTGAAGFVGANLVRRLLDLGVQVTALVRRDGRPWRLEGAAGSLRILHHDLGRRRPLPDVGGVDHVFHLAASGITGDRRDWSAVVEVNVQGTLEVLTLAAERSARSFVGCGSGFEYGGGTGVREDAPLVPGSAYAASKSAAGILAEAFSRTTGLPVTTLRPFNVYGPFEAAPRLVPSVILGSLDDRPVDLSGGEQRRDFLFVGDLVDACLLAAADEGAGHRTLNICSGRARPVLEVVDALRELLDPPPRLNVGAVPYAPDEVWELSGDPTRAAAALGWRPTTGLDEGLRRTVAWFAEERHQYPAYRRESVRG